MGKLTIKQEKFCNKYLECGNASEAYRYAYR
jgi:phage terminase small subunit